MKYKKCFSSQKIQLFLIFSILLNIGACILFYFEGPNLYKFSLGWTKEQPDGTLNPDKEKWRKGSIPWIRNK